METPKAFKQQPLEHSASLPQATPARDQIEQEHGKTVAGFGIRDRDNKLLTLIIDGLIDCSSYLQPINNVYINVPFPHHGSSTAKEVDCPLRAWRRRLRKTWWVQSRSALGSLVAGVYSKVPWFNRVMFGKMPLVGHGLKQAVTIWQPITSVYISRRRHIGDGDICCLWLLKKHGRGIALFAPGQ